MNELIDRKKAPYKEDVYKYLCKKRRSILLSEAVFNNYVNELIANGKIIKKQDPKFTDRKE